MADTTVVIPCYNEKPALLMTAVTSARQNSADVVVVDDGSTDVQTLQTLENLQDRGIRVITTHNGGPSHARNVGIRASTSEYIVPLDSDDHLLPGYIAAMSQALEDRPDVAFVYSGWRTAGLEDATIEPPPMMTMEQLARSCPINNTVLFRRRDWDQLGGYDETLRVGYEDWEWLLRLLIHGGGLATRVDGIHYVYLRREGSRHIVNTRSIAALQVTRTAMLANNPGWEKTIAMGQVHDIEAAYEQGQLQSPLAEDATRVSHYWASRFGRLEGLLKRMRPVDRLWDRFVAKS